VELAPGDLLAGLREHRVGLERASTAFAGEVDGGLRQPVADAATPEPRPGEHARHRPHALVGLVLGPALPWDAEDAQQALVRRARLERAPADGLAIEVGDQAAGGGRPRPAAVRLCAQAERAFFGGE